MNSYKALGKQVFSLGSFSIVPIRMQDRFEIMEWRNGQMYHLRQSTILTEEDQDEYFRSVVSKLFQMEKPDQILFSFLEAGQLIGYGGLVHINWVDKNAEISFIMETSLEEEGFEVYWSKFLHLIEEVAFQELRLHKIFVFAFDVRPHLYPVIEKNGYFKDAVLKDHCFFEGEFINVVIHSKIFRS